jgi:hypothetical protein
MCKKDLKMLDFVLVLKVLLNLYVVVFAKFIYLNIYILQAQSCFPNSIYFYPHKFHSFVYL